MMPHALETLNNDIFLEVLDILRDTSPRSLLNVALTSKALYSLSLSIIYRSICFTFNRNRRDINGNLIRRLLTDSALCANVREIEVFWAPNAKLQPGEGSKADLELLGQALPGMTGLNTFIWDAQYPMISWLLDVLKFHLPKCRLYTFHPPSQDSACTLPRLRGFPCLFSLDVTLLDGQYAACREVEKLLDSPRLRDLTVDTSCDLSNDTQRMLTPLQLRSLELYSCLYHPWRPFTSWSMLERLSMDSISWLPEVASQLTNLKSLHLDVDTDDDRHFLTSFLRSCKRLEVLDLTGYAASVQIGEESLWRHLGKTLVKLRCHENQGFMADHSTPNVTNGEIEMIATECPNLRSLGLNVEGNGVSPKEMINMIASTFLNIVHLEFRVLTTATLDSVAVIWTQVWQTIQRSRPRKPDDVTLPRLRSLDVKGDHQLSFTADRAERDDEAYRGVVVVRCVELEALKSTLSPCGPLWNREQEWILAAVTERAETGTQTGTQTGLLTNMIPNMTRSRAFWDRHDENRFYRRRIAKPLRIN